MIERKIEEIDVQWDDIVPNLAECIEVDESATYEVDMHAIGRHPETKRWVYVYATGCSCWSGDATMYDGNFKTARALLRFMQRTPRYAPGLATQNEMREKLGLPKLRLPRDLGASSR